MNGIKRTYFEGSDTAKDFTSKPDVIFTKAKVAVFIDGDFIAPDPEVVNNIFCIVPMTSGMLFIMMIPTKGRKWPLSVA